MVDVLGLGDALLARLTPQTKPYWIMAQFTRYVPPGYFETLASGRNMIDNPDLAAYYDKLSLIISGRLTDPQRLLTILRMNLGEYNQLLLAYEDSRLLHLTLADIHNPTASAANRDASGLIEFPKQGVKIEIGQTSHSRRIRIGLDDRSSYLIVFSNGAKQTARQLSEGNYSSGLETRVVGLSAEAAAEGYDAITILPGEGTGTYTLDDVELLP